MSKLSASFVSISVLVWVTMVGGSYLRAKHVFQAVLGAGRGVVSCAGLCLICVSRAFWSELSMEWSEAVSFPLSGWGVDMHDIGLFLL